jgi:threonyl-tRNA synthetase
MKKIIKEKQDFKKITLNYEDSKKLLELMDQPFKLELLEEINQR